MKNLFHNLIQPAPDYSGSCGVLYEMGGLFITIDASSCGAEYLFLDDMRWFSAPQRYHSAFIKENDVVMGIDPIVKTRMKGTFEIEGGKFAAIIGTPVPTAIGTDYVGLSKQIEAELGVPCIGIDATGFELYDVGQQKIYSALIDTFADAEVKSDADVHIIGCTPLDMWDQNQTRDLVEILKACGAKHPAPWGLLGSGIEDIANVANSKLNIATSASAVKIVEQLNEKFGTPYIVGFPLGEISTKEFTEVVSAVLEGNAETVADRINCAFRTRDKKEDSIGKSALVVGEQVMSIAIRNLLVSEFGFEKVDIKTYLMFNESVAGPGDCHLVEEDDLLREVETFGPYSIVFGDPFTRQLLGQHASKFFDVAHAAISANLTWTKSPNLMGEKATNYFKEQLTKLEGAE